MNSIGFWKKETGNLMSHKTGLTKEQIEFLQSLKEGDRIIIWANNTPDEPHRPQYTLKKDHAVR